MLNKELIDELQVILKEEYNQNFDTAEVSQIADNLVNYFQVLEKLSYKNNQ